MNLQKVPVHPSRLSLLHAQGYSGGMPLTLLSDAAQNHI